MVKENYLFVHQKIYTIPLLNAIKLKKCSYIYFVNTLVISENTTNYLKCCRFICMEYTALSESRMTNIPLALPHAICHLTFTLC